MLNIPSTASVSSSVAPSVAPSSPNPANSSVGQTLAAATPFGSPSRNNVPALGASPKLDPANNFDQVNRDSMNLTVVPTVGDLSLEAPEDANVLIARGETHRAWHVWHQIQLSLPDRSTIRQMSAARAELARAHALANLYSQLTEQGAGMPATGISSVGQ
jgi:hypothetical protein